MTDLFMYKSLLLQLRFSKYRSLSLSHIKGDMTEFSDECTFQEKLVRRNFITPEEVLVAPNLVDSYRTVLQN
jgi:hypothetical protein